MALILGLLVWRSIHRPIRALHAAALRLGEGDLDASVEIRSGDEFGVLADAFNSMARNLATTMVSISSLESVFGSMAAALVIIDPDRRIINVNRAALDLLGYEREELIAERFAVISPATGDGPIVETRDGGIVALDETTFVTRSGDEIPVSFS